MILLYQFSPTDTDGDDVATNVPVTTTPSSSSSTCNPDYETAHVTAVTESDTGPTNSTEDISIQKMKVKIKMKGREKGSKAVDEDILKGCDDLLKDATWL